MQRAILLLTVLATLVATPASAKVLIRDPAHQTRHGSAAFLPVRSVVPLDRHGEFTVDYEVGRLDVGRGAMPVFRRIVDKTLSDPRGWSDDGAVAFSRVRSDGDFTIWLASPSAIVATGVGCSAYYSCRVGDDVYINVDRWREGATSYRRNSLLEYRQYVVNHEVGHWLGLGHRDCPEPGASAPVLLQQSKGLDGCEPRAWPLPREQQRALDYLGELL